MRFKIDQAILKNFPDLNIGLVYAKSITNTGKSDEILDLLRAKEEEIRNSFAKDTLSQDPKIDSWRKAYSSFGAKPKKCKCSVENLYRMILEDIEIKHINKIVDIYNYISVKHMLPVGGDDIDRIDGDIKLKYADGSESFTELNSDETKNPKEGEIVYADDKEVLCRRWNWRECDKSKMTPETKNVLLVIEGLPPFSYSEIEMITDELKDLIVKHCNAEAQSFVLNNNKSELEIT